MSYELIRNLVDQVKEFEETCPDAPHTVEVFEHWLSQKFTSAGKLKEEPEWEGKSNGRSAESVINTALVHLYRYARLHAKQAIEGSAFATADEFIYLITLLVHGNMTKTALIRRNVQEKSAGMQIVNRLINYGFVAQESFDEDKRNKIVSITQKGTRVLEERMSHIRKASTDVMGNLTRAEQMELIRIFQKLETFHVYASKDLLT